MSSDEDDFDPFSDDELPESPKSKPASMLLRGSLIVAIVAGITIFLTAVAASNSPPNSSAENTALAINTVARVSLLAGFVGVLIAYRLNQIKNIVVGQITSHWQPQPSAPEDASSSQHITPPHSRVEPNGRIKAELRLLLIASGVTLLVLWVAVYAVPSNWGRSIFVVSEAIQLILAAVFATLFFYTNGPIRGFAIGGLTVLAGSRLAGATALMAISGVAYSGYGWENLSQSILQQQALTLTIAFIAAMICACVVGIIEAAKTKSNSRSNS